MVGEEAAAIDLGEDARVAPSLAGRVAILLRGLARTKVQDVDTQQVTRLGALDLDRPAEHVRDVEVDIPHVVR